MYTLTDDSKYLPYLSSSKPTVGDNWIAYSTSNHIVKNLNPIVYPSIVQNFPSYHKYTSRYNLNYRWWSLIRWSTGVPFLFSRCRALNSRVKIVYPCVFLRVSKIGCPFIMLSPKFRSFLRIFIVIFCTLFCTHTVPESSIYCDDQNFVYLYSSIVKITSFEFLRASFSRVNFILCIPPLVRSASSFLLLFSANYSIFFLFNSQKCLVLIFKSNKWFSTLFPRLLLIFGQREPSVKIHF